MRIPQTVYINGRIYTADRDFSVAEAFAVDEDVFSAVGSTKEILALCGPDTKIVDLKGQVVLPGLIDTGCILPNGSDSPVESFNPFLGMYCAISRMDENGDPAGGWRREEAMTRIQALRSYTTWPAYASFEENIRGAVQPGMLADFILIDRDLMRIPAAEIKDVKVLETHVGGERVYKA